MCGICGIIRLGNKPVYQELIRNMNRTIRHRGPDDDGVFIRKIVNDQGMPISIGLGHQRLSIIDLSPAGKQPMCNEDGTIWIVYNGEIYNFQEIRETLTKNGHTFKSKTDTEVILHLYEEIGTEAVHPFNGMFAFAVWDERRSRLWLCRDRAGIKPLVYYWDGETFRFASEIKALLCDPTIPKELDHEAMSLYLTFSYIPAPYTIFKGIRKLEPGQSLILTPEGIRLEPYWEVPNREDVKTTRLPHREQEELFKKRLSDTLHDAVRMRMISDVPIGAFLSGGIDSSIIVGLMAQYSKEPVKTFSIGFKHDALFDETRYARQIASRFKTDHHEFKLIPQDMLDAVSDVLSMFDEPFSDSSAIPTFIVSRETRKHVTVALSGDGGDELFAGYRLYASQYWYPTYMMIPALIRESLFEKLVEKLPDSRDVKLLEYFRRMKKFIRSTRGTFAERLLHLKEIFPASLRASILTPSFHAEKYGDPAIERLERLLKFYQGDPLNRMLYTDFKCSLPGDMLNKVDWMSMKNSLEVRVPLLDYRVIELAFSMPGSLKLNRKTSKYILKETFKDLLPPEMYHRPKAGFEVPISRWLKTDLNFLIQDYLSEDRIRSQGIFEYDEVLKLIHCLNTRETDTSWMVWNLIVFQYWFEKNLL